MEFQQVPACTISCCEGSLGWAARASSANSVGRDLSVVCEWEEAQIWRSGERGKQGANSCIRALVAFRSLAVAVGLDLVVARPRKLKLIFSSLHQYLNPSDVLMDNAVSLCSVQMALL